MQIDLLPLISSILAAAIFIPFKPRATFSISPSSTRNPRIFTCPSMRPKYSKTPSLFQLTKSPVWYMCTLRPHLSERMNGQSTNTSFVFSGRRQYPRPTCMPAKHSSPATPLGRSCPVELTTKHQLLGSVGPTGILSYFLPASNLYTDVWSVHSVGP